MAGGATRTATFVKTGSASAAAAATASGATGIDFSGGMGSVASQIAAALGPGFAVSASGSTLRILDDGAAGTTDVLALSADATISGLMSGGPELPLFLDGGSPYTGSFERGSQLTGFASRIAVNPAVQSDFGALVAYSASTLAGDPTRPEHLLDALRGRSVAVPASAGIDGGFGGSVEDLATRIVAAQAAGAVSAGSFDQGQRVVLNAIQSRFSDLSGVNIDTEMTQLIQLQTAYGANARVMSAAKEMLDMLMTVAR
jgi:flagellar hook-associated protein 1 FlgK